MRPKSDTNPILPPLLFPGKTSKERKFIEQLKTEGLIYQIGPKLYTSLPKKDVPIVVRNNWAIIVSNLYSENLISHITAIKYQPTEIGEIYLTSSSNRTIKFPGLTIKFIRGPKALKDDLSFMQTKASSLSRALLENLTISKVKNSSKCLSQIEIEKILESILLNKGEQELNNIRDQAKKIALKFRWLKAFKRLDNIIGALLNTNSIQYLKSNEGKSRGIGKPYDAHCFGRLESLFAYLRHLPVPELKDTFSAKDHLLNKAFFESYFSNYIEGTIFEIQEAERIVFDKEIPNQRPIDAHDIIETYKIISDYNEIRTVPNNFESFLFILKNRHASLLQKRSEVHPGQFKSTTNRAGNTVFVHPDYVLGTLEKGFDLYLDLPKGFKRAVFIMFLIVDVHPFTDGNGRVARIMMNSELINEGLTSIIIPTVYREDYLLTLRALTRRNDPEPFVRMLFKAYKFSHLEFSPYVRIKKYLDAHNWFLESSEAKIIID